MGDDLTCPDCHTAYLRNAGHCRGGRYAGCCKSWRTGSDFDAHRTGDIATGTRRCLTTDELLTAGWEYRDGLWTSPKSLADAERGRRLAPSRVRGSSQDSPNGRTGTQVLPDDSRATTVVAAHA